MSRGRIARALAPVAVLALLATAPAAPAATGARVAIDPEGTAHVGWTRAESGKARLMGRTRTSAGLLGDADYLSSLSLSAVATDVAAGAPGAAVHAWLSAESSGNRVRLRGRSADGSLGPVQDASGYGVVSPPRIVADPSGAAVVAWKRAVDGHTVLEMRRRSAGGSLGPVTRLSSATPSYNVNEFDIGVDAAGNAVGAWTLSSPTPIAQVRRRTAGGALGATQNLTTSAAAAARPVIAVDPQGNAVIAFRRDRAPGFLVQARRRSASGTLGPLEDVSPVSSSLVNPEIAGDPTGGATIAWAVSGPGERVVHAVRRAADGTYDEIDEVSPDGVFAADFRLGADADGDATFAWQRPGDAGQFIQSRRRSAAGTLFPIVDMAAGALSDMDMGVEPGGGAFVTWADGATNQVVGRRRTEGGELGAANTLSY